MRQSLAVVLAVAAGFALEAKATPYVADTGNSFATRTMLPVGTDVVTGDVWVEDCFPAFCGDVDYFAFTSLLPGAPFTITLTQPAFSMSGVEFDFLTSSRLLLASGWVQWATGESEDIVQGIVPADGELVVFASTGYQGGSYQVVLEAPLVPEPSTALLLAGGLALMAALRRRV